MGGIYGIGVSALKAAQSGLAVTSHNIANVNTPGFSRQEILQTAELPQSTGAGYFGQGANVTTVVRRYDAFLGTQVLEAQTQASNLSTQLGLAQQVSNLLGDANGSLSPALQAFFSAVNGVANAPESIPARQNMLGSAQSLVNRFQSLDQRIGQIRDGLNGQISNSVTMINSYAKQIAALNDTIVQSQARNPQSPPNDLLDQRDQLVSQLSQEIRVSTVKQPDGSLDVFIGNGQSLVINNKAASLQTVTSTTDPSALEVAYLNNGAPIPIQQNALQGGNLGGYLGFRQSVLDPAQNALGRIAMGLADTFNQQHQQGIDLKGALGGTFFTSSSPRVTASTANIGNAVLTATDNSTAALTAQDYKLSFDGTNYSVFNTATNTIVQTFTAAQLATPQAVTGTGITLQLTAGTVANAAGDSYLIRPTVDGAKSLALNITDPTKIAAAVPVRSNAPTTNVGTGVISSASVVPGLPLNANLQQPVTITFNNPPTTYTVTGVGIPALPATYPYIPGGVSLSNASIAAGAPGSNVTVASTANLVVGAPISGGGFPPGTTIASIVNGTTFTTSAPAVPAAATGQSLQVGVTFNGWVAQISGTPAAGDTFTVGPNNNATTDGANILKLAGLQSTNTLAGSTTTYQGAYGQLISQVGSQTRELDVTNKAQTTLLNQVTKQQQSISGVNLDEEAANLLKYQQAYQAAAKAMAIGNTMFDSVLQIAK